MRRVDALGQLQLTLEAGDVIGIDGECRVQQLERDDLSRLLVAGLPDHAHAATAEFGQKREALSHGVYNSTDARAVSPSLVPPVIRTR